MPTKEYRKILLNGRSIQVTLEGDELVTEDGRSVGIEEAQHLPPTQPSKIICVHLNYESRVKEYITKLPPAPTYFHKPITALNSHKGDVVRPERCKWLNYEGEIAIVIGRNCRNISPADAGEYIAGYTIANDYGLHDFRDTDAGQCLGLRVQIRFAQWDQVWLLVGIFITKESAQLLMGKLCKTPTLARWSGI